MKEEEKKIKVLDQIEDSKLQNNSGDFNLDFLTKPRLSIENQLL